jgi:tryptophan synthase alpha chain
MNLAEALARRRVDGRCGFVPFIECGDRTAKETERYVLALERAGADIIELGVPFSDPVADGPTIQLASERALKGGASLAKALALTARLRAAGAPPIVLFTYLNPVLRMGRDAFAKACGKAGVAGALIVDLPAEEWADWKTALEKRGVEPVLLASPTTTDERLRLIAKRSGSIVYYVSREGVTGVRAKMTNINRRLRHVRRTVGKPLIVGFGVSTRDQARALAAHCDGVVVGSALVAAAAAGGETKLGRLARDIVAGLSL